MSQSGRRLSNEELEELTRVVDSIAGARTLDLADLIAGLPADRRWQAMRVAMRLFEGRMGLAVDMLVQHRPADPEAGR